MSDHDARRRDRTKFESGRDGLDVAREISAHPAAAHVPTNAELVEYLKRYIVERDKLNEFGGEVATYARRLQEQGELSLSQRRLVERLTGQTV